MVGEEVSCVDSTKLAVLLGGGEGALTGRGRGESISGNDRLMLEGEIQRERHRQQARTLKVATISLTSRSSVEMPSTRRYLLTPSHSSELLESPCTVLVLSASREVAYLCCFAL